MQGRPTILLLAGTAEAREVAAALAAGGRWRVLASLAGATAHPAEIPADMRRGGFGGAEGMAAALRRDRVAAVIDATHPFAARISANAEAACAALGLPRIAVRRPHWRPGPGDDWRPCPDLDAAAAALPPLSRAFLTVGRRSLDAFRGRADVWFLARVIEPPSERFPLPRGEFAVGRPPFAVAHERALMQDRRITHLVAKNSGGDAGLAKLAAARALGLPVLMIGRPPPPDGPLAQGAREAVDWLASLGLG